MFEMRTKDFFQLYPQIRMHEDTMMNPKDHLYEGNNID